MSNYNLETALNLGVLDIETWIHRWEIGDIRFHKPGFTPALNKFEEKIFKGQKRKVFVPLCGKSLDLLWFYERGHVVCGVEVAEQPVRELFEEHSIEVGVTEIENIGKLYKSRDGRLQLYVADIFDMTFGVCGKFDIIYDCRALSAVNVAEQMTYAELMLSFTKEDGVYLLYTKEYDPIVWPGPPHTISEDTVKDLFGERCHIEKFDEEDRNFNDSSPASTKNCAASELTSSGGTFPGMKASSYLFTRWFCMTNNPHK